tara:strand:+ start:721 stop:999 length:279 start_codon:yes stop_codon:yes gene_type:complete
MKPHIIDPFGKPDHLIQLLKEEGEVTNLSVDQAGFDTLLERLLAIGIDGELANNNEFIMHVCESFEAGGVLCSRNTDDKTIVAISKPEATSL